MLNHTAKEIVETLAPKGIIIGDPNRVFSCPIDIEHTWPDSISFLTSNREFKDRSSVQGVVITNISCNCDETVCTLIFVENPRKLFVDVLEKYFKQESKNELHNCILIGSTIDISGKVKFGKNISINSGCVIGGDGFSYERQDDGSLKKFLHYGGVRIGSDVEIGSNTTIDRGTFRDTIIGDGTKIDNLVHVAHNVEIGKHCMIIAHAGIGGGVKIGDRCFIGLGAVIRDGVVIGNDCFIGMGAVVVKDAPDGTTVMGNPAEIKNNL